MTESRLRKVYARTKLEELTQLFDLGIVLVTPGVMALLDERQQAQFLARHWRGNFGKHGNFWDIVETLTDDELEHGAMETNEDSKLNAIAIRTGGDVHNIVLSVYEHQERTFWILTHIGQYTTLLLPSEY